MYGQPRAKKYSIAQPRAAPQSGQRSENQASRRSGERASPIAVHPLVERSEFHDSQQAAHERPTGRGPAAQHPITERAKRRHRDQHRGPGSAEDHPAEGQRRALANRVDRAVSWLLQDEKRLEEPMERMRRIRQAKMPQRVRHQQMTEFVINIRHGRGMAREKQQPQHHRQRGQQQDRPDWLLREPARIGLQPGTPHQRNRREQRRQTQFNEVGGSHAERIGEWQKLGQVREQHAVP